MPKVRRQSLPRGLYAHLLDRVQQRSISAEQLRLLLRWMEGFAVQCPALPGCWSQGSTRE